MDGTIYHAVLSMIGQKQSKRSVYLQTSCKLSSMFVKIFIVFWENTMNGVLVFPFWLHLINILNLRKPSSINMFASILKRKMTRSYPEPLKEFLYTWSNTELILKFLPMFRIVWTRGIKQGWLKIWAWTSINAVHMANKYCLEAIEIKLSPSVIKTRESEASGSTLFNKINSRYYLIYLFGFRRK